MSIVVRDKWGDPIWNASFNEHVDVLLSHKAESKGYDGEKGQLFSLCHQLPHPLGEIIYKVVRYHKQGDPDDLLKIAGWARILWERKRDDVNREGSDSRNCEVAGPARPVEPGPRQGNQDSNARSSGGGAGGGRNVTATSDVYDAARYIAGPSGRTGSSGRGRGAVDSKYRQRKGARKTL